MASAVASLHKKGLLGTPPQFLMNNTMYETITGSESYGVTSNDSDRDVVGFCIPPKNIVFPHLAGEIQGFGRQIQRFEQFQLHGIKDLPAHELLVKMGLPTTLRKHEVEQELKRRGLL